MNLQKWVPIHQNILIGWYFNKHCSYDTALRLRAFCFTIKSPNQDFKRGYNIAHCSPAGCSYSVVDI